MEWGSKPGAAEAPKTDRWPKSLRLFRRLLSEALDKHGCELPEGGGIRAVDIEVVRTEFYKSYAADGDTSQKKQRARQRAFHRAVAAAQAATLINVREVAETTFIWPVP